MSAATGFPSTARLLWTQTVYQLRSFRRIPIAVFFTLGLPLIMLVLFNALFGSTPGRHAHRIVVDGAVLHRWAGRVHRGVGHVHQPRQHGPAPA